MLRSIFVFGIELPDISGLSIFSMCSKFSANIYDSRYLETVGAVVWSIGDSWF